MYTRWLLVLVFTMLFGKVALANDDWGWDWDETGSVEEANNSAHNHADDGGTLLPLHSLSLATHGAYFGSGNEFLLGGADVFGLGGSRHSSGHNTNHPTYGVYPEIQHLFGNEVGFLGPMWGAPADFSPAYSELASGQPTDGVGPTDKPQRGNPGIINDDGWWLD